MPELDQADLSVNDFMAQAAAILAASKARYADATMLKDDEDEDQDNLDDPEDQDNLDDQDPDDEDDPDDQDDEDSKPATKDDGSPVTKKDFRALNEALKKERKEHRALKRAKAAGGGQPSDEVKAAAEEAAAAKFKPLIVNQAAKAAFVAAGLKLPEGREDSVMKRVLKQLDMEDLELDDDGEVDGLDDQIGEIKADFPELFEAPKRKRTGRNIDGAERGKGAAGSDEDSASLLTKQMRGGR